MTWRRAQRRPRQLTLLIPRLRQHRAVTPSGNQAPTDTTNVAAPHLGSAGLVPTGAAPVLPGLPDLLDVLQAAAPDTAGSTDQTVASAASVADPTDPVLAATTGAGSQ